MQRNTALSLLLIGLSKLWYRCEDVDVCYVIYYWLVVAGGAIRRLVFSLRLHCFGTYFIHRSKPVMTFVFKVLRNGLLRYILYTCPNLWWRSLFQVLRNGLREQRKEKWKRQHCTIETPLKLPGDLRRRDLVSDIFYFHPYLGKISNLTNIFQMGWSHQLDYIRPFASV